MVKGYQDLEIWKRAIILVRKIYDATKSFPKEEIYGLTSQIRRAAVSIPSNIAEGHSRKHSAEFKQFLYIALGSIAEVETQIIITSDLGYVSSDLRHEFLKELDEIGKMTRGLVARL